MGYFKTMAIDVINTQASCDICDSTEIHCGDAREGRCEAHCYHEGHPLYDDPPSNESGGDYDYSMNYWAYRVTNLRLSRLAGVRVPRTSWYLKQQEDGMKQQNEVMQEAIALKDLLYSTVTSPHLVTPADRKRWRDRLNVLLWVLDANERDIPEKAGLTSTVNIPQNSFSAQLAEMRKPQTFVVLSEDSDSPYIRIASERALGEIDPETGAGRLNWRRTVSSYSNADFETNAGFEQFIFPEDMVQWAISVRDARRQIAESVTHDIQR